MLRSEIKSLASHIQPLDKEEADHITFVENWIDSGVEIFRVAKPATPDPRKRKANYICFALAA